MLESQRLPSDFGKPAPQVTGYLYFSLVVPMGGHGSAPGNVMYQEMRIRRSGESRASLWIVACVCCNIIGVHFDKYVLMQ